MIYNGNIHSGSVTLVCRLFIRCRMIVQVYLLDHDPTTSYMLHVCKRLWKLQTNPTVPKSCDWSEDVGVGTLQSTSKRSPESSRRTAWRNQADSQGASKSWAFWSFGSECPGSHSDSCISVQTESLLERLTCCVLLYDPHGRFHCRRSATNAAKKLPECMLWKKNTRKR